jgi:hypothetical protein
VYQFTHGWFKGFEIGGSIIEGWKKRVLYYYTNGIAGQDSPRALFSFPTQSRFDLIAGYRFKLGRFAVISQLNVNNIFNHYHIIVLPDPTTGWTTPSRLNATFDQQPRSWIWTNTLSF